MAATTTFLFSNCFSYKGMTDASRSIHAHDMIKNKYAAASSSSWSLVAKDVRKVNGIRSFGGIRGTMFSGPKMMLDLQKEDVESERMVKDGLVFRQNVYIRTYEVGPDKRLTTETLLNLLQETCIKHLKVIGVSVDGLGVTREMFKKKLIWVMAKLQVDVDRYPIWGDVIQFDTWKGPYGKIGMCSNWKVCDSKTGEVLLKASCIWLMMNEETRKLSKFPDQVRAELNEYFTDTTPPATETRRKRDETTNDHVHYGLTPRWSDLDVNQHANNVKYIGWIMESVPTWILEKHELASMTLEYFKECTMESVLQSHTFLTRPGSDRQYDNDHIDCEHVLQFENGGGDIMKGWTRWRTKHVNRV